MHHWFAGLAFTERLDRSKGCHIGLAHPRRFPKVVLEIAYRES